MLKNWGSGTLFEVQMLKNCTPLWRTAHSEVKMLKNWGSGNTFWSSDVEKLHAAVANGTFGSENAQNMTCSEHFCTFRCRKIARRCGEKHIWKSKCTKHVSSGQFFEVRMSKNCTPLWRTAHSEVKMLKNWGSGSTFWSSDVGKLHAAVANGTFGSENVKKLRVREHFWSSDVEKLHAAVANGTFGSENVKKLRVREHFLKFRCWKIARRCGERHIRKWKCTKHDVFGALLYVQMSKNCTPLWRKAHLEVKMYKTRQQRTVFWSSDVEKLHAAVANGTFGSENVKKLRVREHFLKFRCWKIARRCGERHIRKWKC